jgi:hypothetical protein
VLPRRTRSQERGSSDPAAKYIPSWVRVAPGRARSCPIPDPPKRFIGIIYEELPFAPNLTVSRDVFLAPNQNAPDGNSLVDQARAGFPGSARGHALQAADWRGTERSNGIVFRTREYAGREEHQDKLYPWGTRWPPPSGAGNYRGVESKMGNVIDGYNDGYPRTSPVGSFASDKNGLYDMGGNAWQWCEDWYNSAKKDRVLRGASWFFSSPGILLASRRGGDTPGERGDHVGFVVL